MLIGRFWFACRATIVCLVAPAPFAAMAKTYDAGIPPTNVSHDHDSQNRRAARLLRNAFWISCLLTIGSLLVGYSLGAGLKCLVGPAAISTATFVQALSAALVLIATLAARGWDIQTYNGNTLIERVNQWLTEVCSCLEPSSSVCSLAGHSRWGLPRTQYRYGLNL
jgi:hypothetical protein